MKPWLNNPYVINAQSIQEIEEVLTQIFGSDEQGELLTVSHNHFIHIYQKSEPTGLIISDGEGNDYPTVDPLPGYFADVRVRVPEPSLNAFAIEPNESVAKYYESLARQTRLDIEFGLLPFGDVWIQTDVGKDGVRGIDRLKGVITEVAINPHKENESINWISSDNSVVTLTYHDVAQLVSAFNMRQQSLFNQYAQWRSGDRQEPFKPSLENS